MWTRKELKQKAKAGLKLNYWKAVLVCGIILPFLSIGSGSSSSSLSLSKKDFILSASSAFNLGLRSRSLVSMVMGAVVLMFIILAVISLIIIKALLTNPLEVGIAKFELNALNSEANVSDIGSGFDVSYKRNAKAMFIFYLYIFIGVIIFVIPGVILSYQLMMVPFILVENPDVDRKQAFTMSREMMKGNKWKAFVLDLSFLPWAILSIITLGIVNIFYVSPYIRLTHAALYEAIKKQ